MNIKEMIKEYQCSGCIKGPYLGCFKKSRISQSCGEHCVGTIIQNIGKIFLGMPKGFNRLGPDDNLKIEIFESEEEFKELWGDYDNFNFSIWKYVDKNNNTLVRCYSPRLNLGSIHIIGGDIRQLPRLKPWASMRPALARLLKQSDGTQQTADPV